jgi:REP element-mobilizing transposase RayT
MTPDTYRRRSIRLSGYDYRQPGAYFVTLVTHARESLFGEVVQGGICLSALGEIVTEEWLLSAQMRDEIQLDDFVVMPNHLHGLIVMTGDVGAHGRAPLRPVENSHLVRRPRSLGALIAGFKAASTKRINRLRAAPGMPVWQRNYYERIVRSEDELNRIRQYILDNSANWHADPENRVSLNTNL